MEKLESINSIVLLDWPSQSAHANPIENIKKFIESQLKRIFIRSLEHLSTKPEKCGAFYLKNSLKIH